ncbi:hypothetical protein EJB05_44080, partial [Eragrostis curvula]
MHATTLRSTLGERNRLGELVKCSSHNACSQDWVTVTVTDVCRRAVPCLEDPKAAHFELSGHAFGAMAKPGRSDELRAASLVTVLYEWVDCQYTPPAGIVYPVFQTLPGSTNEDFAMTVLYIEGFAIAKMVPVFLRNAGDSDWQLMTRSQDRPAVWTLTDDSTRRPLPVRPPLSIKIDITWVTRGKDDVTVIAEDVIPVGWQSGMTYYNATELAGDGLTADAVPELSSARLIGSVSP